MPLELLNRLLLLLDKLLQNLNPSIIEFLDAFMVVRLQELVVEGYLFPHLLLCFFQLGQESLYLLFCRLADSHYFLCDTVYCRHWLSWLHPLMFISLRIKL